MSAVSNLRQQARCRGPVPPVPTSVMCCGEAPAGAGVCVDGRGRGLCAVALCASRPENSEPGGVPVPSGIEMKSEFENVVRQADSGQPARVVHGSASGPGSGGELPHPQGLSTRQVWAGQLSTAGERSRDVPPQSGGVPGSCGSSAQVTGKRTFSGQLCSAGAALKASVARVVSLVFWALLIVAVCLFSYVYACVSTGLPPDHPRVLEVLWYGMWFLGVWLLLVSYAVTVVAGSWAYRGGLWLCHRYLARVHGVLTPSGGA